MASEEDIENVLQQIEGEYGVEIMDAREFGSRAWGLATEESDHDIAIVFTQPKEAYISLDRYIETIDRTYHDGDIEIMGFNLKYFMKHVRDCKPNAIEFLKSPIRYRESGKLDELEDYIEDNFKEVSLYHHYRQLGKSQYERYLKDRKDTTVKRNIYVFRGFLYAQHIKKKGTLPPMDFVKFVEEGKENKSLDIEYVWEDVYEMVQKKKKGLNPEIGVPQEEWIIEKTDEMIDTDRSSIIEKEKLDEFLLDWIK